jgi:O-antigen ligase
MDLSYKIRKVGLLGNEELMFSIFCTGIAWSLIFWPLINSLFCIALAAYWLLFSQKDFSFSKVRSRWVVLFVSVFVMVIIGTLYSSDLSTALVQLQRKIAILAFPLVFGTSAIISPLIFKRTFTALIWSTFFGCLFCIFNGLFVYFQRGVTDHLHGYQMIVLKDMPPFILGLCCLLSFVYLLNNVYEANRNGSTLKAADFMFLAFFLFFSFLLGNRTILFLMSGAILFYTFHLFTKLFQRVIIFGCLVLSFALAIILNPSLDRQWNDMIDFSTQNNIEFDKDETLNRSWGGKTIRLTIWRCSWDIIKTHWLLGVGTGDVQAALQQAYENRKFYFASRYNTYNAHNQYIQTTIAYGLVGLSIFVTAVFAPVFLCYQQKRNTFYLIFLLCFAFVCVTESILELNKGIIWYSFFNSLFMFRKFN